MGWRQFVRSVQADARRRERAVARAEREAMRHHRELVRRERELAKEAAKLQAASEAEQFERYLEILVSIHKDASRDLDWQALTKSEPPTPPVADHSREATAAEALASYRPGFIARLFGGDKKTQAKLEHAVGAARAADEAAFRGASQAHVQAHADWAARKALAQRVLARDPSAYSVALESAGALEELEPFQTEVMLGSAEQDGVVLECQITDDEIVPREEVKLTSTGKLSTKSMAPSRYWSLYQDHICSAAIRVARETFSTLLVSRVIVHIGPIAVNARTGHREPVAYLAVQFARETLKQLNLERIDPSESMKNFPHRMKFKKASGFEPVTPMALNENWITGG